MKAIHFVEALALLALCACQTTPPAQNVDPFARVASLPVPTTDAERDAQCASIRAEIDRQYAIGRTGANLATSDQVNIGYQVTARQNIKFLVNREATIHCEQAATGQGQRLE